MYIYIYKIYSYVYIDNYVYVYNLVILQFFTNFLRTDNETKSVESIYN